MSYDFQNITFDIADDIASLTLNRPQCLNALNRSMLGEIIAALDGIRDRRNARVLVIRGAGRGFCSGADLADGAVAAITERYDAGEVLERCYNPLIERLADLPVPIVASVHGAVSGAGCMLALTADIVLAARTAYFVQAFVNVGLTPDAGSLWLLPRIAGRARALSMMLLGERISADTAADWGLIHRVVDDQELEESTASLAAKLARGPTLAYELIRRGVRAGLQQTLSETLMTERRSQLLAGRSQDFAEGVAAFREKRPAAFKGR